MRAGLWPAFMLSANLPIDLMSPQKTFALAIERDRGSAPRAVRPTKPGEGTRQEWERSAPVDIHLQQAQKSDLHLPVYRVGESEK